MKRVFMNLVVIVSALLAVASVVVWVRSLWLVDMALFTSGPAFCQVVSQDSTIYVEINTDCRPFSMSPEFQSQAKSITVPPSLFNWHTLGFGWRTCLINYAGMPMGLKSRLVRVPDWFLGAVFVIPPIWVLYRRRFRRRGPGLCPTCSYDLRGHHAGERCPECGRVIVGESSASKGLS